MNDDNLRFFPDEMLGENATPEEPVPSRAPGAHHRVVLLPDVPRLDEEAELDRVMPRNLADEVSRVNVALKEILPDAGAHFVTQGRLVRLEAKAPDMLDLLPDTVAFDLVYKLASVAPAAEFRGAYLGSLHAGLQRYATELVDALTERARKKILAREAELHRRGPLHRLKDDDRKLVEDAKGELPILGPMSVDEVDELWAGIHAAAPWLQAASVEAWRAMRHEVGAGRGAWIPPILLNGEPGTGKTSLGRSLAASLGVPLVEIDAGNGTAAFQVSGVEKGWSGAEPGLLIEAILQQRTANPVVIVNELCRAGAGMMSQNGTRTSLSDALLALLDRGSSRRWRCPALRVDFDVSRVIWVLTSNRVDTIDPALLSRMRVVDVRKPSAGHIAEIVRRRLSDIDEDLAGHAAEVIAKVWSRRVLTLRQVDAMCERVLRSLTGPRLH
ncbi:AAA family ATPase [Pararhodobacter oceanensis]|uniref:AAA+ ATPase domain-containing protein n=1 Tax=Pararhodobacter oceanensis TaxID=2172121 RepID=A0A2T8HS23_9RHOB|nr:AAA family ATPase [Pararhodobacter oceanensis]PVH28236.1 hypothetical protein DDE20_14125 [Pararhodobacter oceanensis]